MAKKSKYQPNKVPLSTRILFTISALGLVSYVIVALVKGEFFIFGTRGRSMFLNGLPMWLMATCFLLAAANLFSDVVDHLDKRDNEKNYVKFRWITKNLAWIFFFASLIVNFYLFFQSPPN